MAYHVSSERHFGESSNWHVCTYGFSYCIRYLSTVMLQYMIEYTKQLWVYFASKEGMWHCGLQGHVFQFGQRKPAQQRAAIFYSQHLSACIVCLLKSYEGVFFPPAWQRNVNDRDFYIHVNVLQAMEEAYLDIMVTCLHDVLPSPQNLNLCLNGDPSCLLCWGTVIP